MHHHTNDIERLAHRLLNDGYVDDEVEAYRLAVKILMVAGRRPSKDDDDDG